MKLSKKNKKASKREQSKIPQTTKESQESISMNISCEASKLTCPVSIGQQRYRAILDTGSMICVARRDVYDRLPRRFKNLKETKLVIRDASGRPLDVLGMITCDIRIEGIKAPCDFYVVSHLQTSMIIGVDFLKNNGARIDLMQETLEFGGKCMNLTTSEKVSSFGRLSSDIEIPPQTAVSCTLQYHKDLTVRDTDSLQVTSIESGFFGNEPGVFLINGVAKPQAHRRVAGVLVNNTTRFMNFKKGNVIASIEVLKDSDLLVCQAEGVDEQKDSDKDDKKKGTGPVEYNINDSLITEKEKQQLIDLLDENEDLFAKHDYDIGRTELIEARIKTSDEIPIRKKPYGVPLALRDKVDQQINQLLQHGVIRPSNSPWAFPLVVAKKKNGKLRLCVDYRLINAKTEKFYWPMGSIDDIFASLAKARYFSSLDISNAYHHIPVAEEDIPKTAFVWEKGVYEYGTLPFGLSNAPSYWSQLMSIVLNGVENAKSYLDDIILYTDTFEKHLETLKIVFDRIRKANLKLNKKKCEFIMESMKYLGHLLTIDGLKPDPDKVQVILDYESPKNVKEVRSFMGMANFFRRYLPDLAKQAKPLTRLTGKNAKFEWLDEHQVAFEEIKKALTSPPVLKFPDPDKPFELWCDASSGAIGAVLIQRDTEDAPHPVQYISHQLSKQQQKWPIIEKECFAIVFAMEKLRTILWGREFMIYSDHAPLQFIRSAQMKNPKVQRWCLKIDEYGGNIRHVAGKANSVADFLSRMKEQSVDVTKCGDDVRCHLLDSKRKGLDKNDEVRLGLDKVDVGEELNLENEMTNDEDDGVHRQTVLNKHVNIREHQELDAELRNVIRTLRHDPDNASVSDYLLVDEILYYVGEGDHLRLVLPSDLHRSVIDEAHTGYLGGHLGARKVYDTLSRDYYFKRMYTKVFKFVQACDKCKAVNLRKKSVPIQEMPVPKYPFEQIAIDTCGPFMRTTNGNQYILTVVDLFSGYIESKCVPNKTAEEVAKFIMDEIIPRHSVPKTILSDRGTEFCNKVIAYITEFLGIGHIRTSPYNPNANGRCERTHRVLSECLTKLVEKDEQNWDTYVNNFAGAYNCADHANTGYSPFRLIYNRQPVYPLDTILQDREKYYGEDFGPQSIERLHTVFRTVKNNLVTNAKDNRDRHNLKVKNEDINVGDAVYVYNHRRTSKLQPRWLSGYTVIKKTGAHTYRLQKQNTQEVSVQHGRNLRKAGPNDNWLRPHGRKEMRKARLVMAPEDDEAERNRTSESKSESDSEGHRPLRNDWTRGNESDDSEEDNIPLAQLRNRLPGVAHNRTVPWNRGYSSTVPAGTMHGPGTNYDNDECIREGHPSYPARCTSTYRAGPIVPRDVGNDRPNQMSGTGVPGDEGKNVPCEGQGGTQVVQQQDSGGNPALNTQDGIGGNVGVNMDSAAGIDASNTDATNRPSFNLRGRTVYKNVVPRKRDDIRASVRESHEDSRRDNRYKLHCERRGLTEDGEDNGYTLRSQMDTSINRKRGLSAGSTSEEDKIPNKKVLVGALTELVQMLQADLDSISNSQENVTDMIDDTADVLCTSLKEIKRLGQWRPKDK